VGAVGGDFDILENRGEGGGGGGEGGLLLVLFILFLFYCLHFSTLMRGVSDDLEAGDGGGAGESALLFSRQVLFRLLRKTAFLFCLLAEQVAEQALVDSSSRPPLPPLTRDSVLLVASAHDTSRMTRHRCCLLWVRTLMSGGRGLRSM
jgi:hypothetical protein